MPDVTRILSAIDDGDPHAAEQLLPLVYDELRKLATDKLAHEKPGQTLDPTALVHEAYVRLAKNATPPNATRGRFTDQRHFFAAAADAMRRILIDRARRKRSRKRGGAWIRTNLDEADIAAPECSGDLLALDEAITKLAGVDAAAAELVHLRFFAGLPISEVAPMLGISSRTADR